MVGQIPREPSRTVVVIRSFLLKPNSLLYAQNSTLKGTKHTFPLTYFRSFVNQNLNTSTMRSKGSSESPIATKYSGRSRYVQYLPSCRISMLYFSDREITTGESSREIRVDILDMGGTYSRLGRGSSSCEGRENRTDAMSATPMNLEKWVSEAPTTKERRRKQ